MTSTITTQMVRDYTGQDLPYGIVNGYIAFVAGADACLDASGVPDEVQEALKLNAIAHLISMSGGSSGEVTSESSMTGASVTYKQSNQSDGLGATAYGRALQQMDSTGCVTGLFKQPRFMRAIGRGY